MAALVLIAAACSGGGSPGSEEVGDDRRGPNQGPLPTLAGGVELEEVDPLRLLVGSGISFGTPLPSEEAAAAAFAEDPEVRAVVVRRAYDGGSGRLLADVRLLQLEGAEVFDEAVLRGFQDGIVGGLAGAEVGPLDLAGRRTLHAVGPDAAVVGFREGNVLAIVSAPPGADADATLVATRQIEALARGEAGDGTPRTPLVALPVDSAFVPAPTIAFTPFSPPEEEAPPEPPGLGGALAISGRYGVVAGERRTTVWSIAVEPVAYGTAEALQPAMADLVGGRAGGQPVEQVELLGRLVARASAPVGERSAQAFRHQALVLVVEGNDPAQLDAVTTAWITALDQQDL